MIYKKRPGFRVRPFGEIEEDLKEARRVFRGPVRSLFLPDGNTIAMKTAQLAAVCRSARRLFPELERITVYGSSPFLLRKGASGLAELAEAGLSRIHVGLESGDDEILRRIRKGCDSRDHVEAGRLVKQAGIELSFYVILGIGGRDRSREHADETARVINAVDPDFIRLRTFVPKVDTPMLEEVRSGRFRMLGPHDVLRETERLMTGLTVSSRVTSDHYTNYIDLEGRLPGDKPAMRLRLREALARSERTFRPFFVGTA
jgi:radical SAM superfamily enzyme YgiQ (UPF0313 family)